MAAASGAADPYAPVLGIRGEGALDPVFCVHGGVGLALPYLGLTESVDRDRPIVGLQAPAADPDVPLPGSVPEVAADYVRRVQEIQPSGPYHLFGWSYGGIVAQEMAVQLQAAGERVALLVSVDGYPFRAGSQDIPAEQDLVSSFTEYLDVDMSGYEGGPEGLPGNAAELLSLLESTASPLAAMGLRRVERFVDLMRHHGELVAAHVPRVFDGDIHVVVSMSDGTPDPREQAARWRPGVTGAVVAVALDAEHNLMMHPRPGRTIGRVLDGWLTDLPTQAATRTQGAGR
ncbi:thioesterase domain-containing protein [Georgenia sp. Marseille-Q6866]